MTHHKSTTFCHSECILNDSRKQQAAEKAHFEAIVCAVFMFFSMLCFFFLFRSRHYSCHRKRFFLESNSWQQLTPKHLLFRPCQRKWTGITASCWGSSSGQFAIQKLEIPLLQWCIIGRHHRVALWLYMQAHLKTVEEASGSKRSYCN